MFKGIKTKSKYNDLGMWQGMPDETAQMLATVTLGCYSQLVHN